MEEVIKKHKITLEEFESIKSNAELLNLIKEKGVHQRWI